jgi:short-subunit dehydrogenase
MHRIQILKNKNVFITGASGGLGEQIALEFAKRGCNLYLTGRDTEKLKNIIGQIEESNYDVSATCQVGDLRSLDDIAFLIEEARKTLGQIDVLVNCAGEFMVSALNATSIEDFDNCFNVNVRAPFIFCQEFIKDMVANKWGRIINIGSSSSYSGFKNTSIYCASKHALLGLSRSLHDELKHHNVRTFCFSPGSIKTEMGKQVKGQLYETFIDPREIAEYIVFMVSFNEDMISEEVRLNRVNVQ